MTMASKSIAGGDLGKPVSARGGRIAVVSATAITEVHRMSLLGLQLLGLWAISIAGNELVRALKLPIPGNLLGMMLLYALLAFGIVKIAWFEAAGSLLVKHLAFFFVPVAVGIMDAGQLLAGHGVAIAAVLLASAIIGIALSSLVARSLAEETQEPGAQE